MTVDAFETLTAALGAPTLTPEETLRLDVIDALALLDSDGWPTIGEDLVGQSPWDPSLVEEVGVIIVDLRPALRQASVDDLARAAVLVTILVEDGRASGM